MNLIKSKKTDKFMRALLSIKPQFVEKIFSGDKKYEYRKVIFSRTDVTTIVVYCTSPVGKIVGEFKIGKILKDTPEDIWQQTKRHSGVEKEFYDEYFKNRESAYAIGIIEPLLYEYPINPYNDVNFVAPQSFMYLNKV
jgi:predicted transcriptional regulator